MSKKNIEKLISENQIKWIQVHFTDVIGGLRVVHFPSERFIDDDLLKKGFRFDGSSVGFRRVEKSDMIGIPDPDTFLCLPHQKDEALMRADLYDTDLNLYRADPRTILKKAIKDADSNGFNVEIAPELEFCIFNRFEENEDIRENLGYFISPPLDDVKEYRKVLSNYLIESGYKVKYHHHEKGKYQHEIETKSMNVLDAADFCMYFKYIAREVAEDFDLDITFMPKPLSGEAGNGMHAHILLTKNNKNLFYDSKDEFNLSQTAKYFIAGLLDHAKGLTAIGNPTLNSYKRLIPNFEAPIYIAWARYNRSSLIRIPAKKDVDVEIRNADPAANPYLLFAGMIHAGLDGIRKKKTYKPVSQNIYDMSEEELEKNNIQSLPTNLMQALEEFESDDVLYNGIGKDAANLFIERKKNEWRLYMDDITDLDYRFYFNC